MYDLITGELLNKPKSNSKITVFGFGFYLSTMEAETIDVDNCCWYLVPIIDITQSLGTIVGLPVGVPSMKVSVCKNNSGALILDRTLPPKFTPCSKYYATKTIPFCEGSRQKEDWIIKSCNS